MDKDEKFIARWKPIHEKNIVKYVILGSLINLLIVSLLTVIVIWTFPRSQIKVDWLIMTNAVLFMMFIALRTLEWFKGEKRYKKIINKEF